MYFLRYSPRGFYLNRGDRVLEIDVHSNVLESYASPMQLPDSQLSQNFYAVFYAGKFYAAYQQTLYEFDGPRTEAKMRLKRHCLNCLFVNQNKLYFVSHNGELYDASSLSDLRYVQSFECGFQRYQVQFCYSRIFLICDGSSVHEIVVRDRAFDVNKLGLTINGVWFAAVNVIIDLDQVCYDLIQQKKYQPLLALGNDFQASLVPLEIGWVIDRAYFELHYGGGFEEVRQAGSMAFQHFFNELYETQKREKQG